MKRTMKKHLSLILAVLMLFTSVGFNVIAAGECNHQTELGNPKYQKVTAPTCTERGYTEHLCIFCGQVVGNADNYKDPLGHKYGEFTFEPVDENDLSKGYYKYRTCERAYVVENQDEPVICGHKDYEQDGNKNAVYFLVQFVNNKVVDTYDESITYTKVADTSAYKSELLYSEYVKKGDEAIYACDTVPFTDKTKAYSSYTHIGWTTDDDLHATVDDNLTEEDCVSLANIQENTVFYPVFEGDIRSYDVEFHKLNNEPLTRIQKVLHGASATYRIGGIETNDYYENPTQAEDLVNTYEFAGWVTSNDDTKVIATEDIENTPIYDNITFFPKFNAVKKNYTLELYDAEKSLLRYNGQDAVLKNVNLNTNLFATNDANSNILGSLSNENAIKKESDKIYDYYWTGSWQTFRADGSLGNVVNLTSFNVEAVDIISYENGEKVIRLIPVFERVLIRYAVEIEMARPYGEDDSYYRGEAEIQIIANNNQLVAAGKTDANGKFRCLLNYQVPFTVRVASYDGKYLGETVITNLHKSDISEEEEATKLNYFRIVMEKNPEYEKHCSCIHHNSLLQPIIVRIYNMLYSFFNYKYVCCYDMYSTIGPLLEYTKD